MNNMLAIAILSVFCVVGLLLLVGGVIALLLIGRRPDYGSVAALEAFDRRIVGWADSGRLSGEIAVQVRALISGDRAQLLGWAVPTTGVGRPTTGGMEPESVPHDLAGSEPARHPPVAPRRQMISALVALATRRTLLFLGSFLLAVSALTLVVFNWASFPPLIQIALLASVVGGLWAGGAWMIRRPDLAAAGRNLQAVAGLLVPAVAFALTRPGLLDMAPRTAWLTVSLLSLPVYLLAAWRTGRGFYSTSAAMVGVSALLAAQSWASLPAQLWPPSLAALALGYLGLGIALERPRLALAQPILIIAPLLGGTSLLASLTDPEIARTTLPILVAFGAALATMIERGRIAWVARLRYTLATTGLAMAALLLPGWLLAMLDLSALSVGVRGMILAPLAAAYFVGASWWPGKVRRSYDLSLQTAGTLVAMLSGAATLFDAHTWVPGAVFLALIWALQATLRQGRTWAALALSSAMLAGGLALARAPTLSESWWIWTGVGYAAAYAVGGSLLRAGKLRHWTWPAIGWGTLAGLGALSAIAASMLKAGRAGPSESLAILALSGIFALATWIWRRSWLGYPAAALLILGALLAAARGFYTGWVPAAGDLALVACALAGTLGLLGQRLRARAAHVYAPPYEYAGLALLCAAPLLGGGDSAHLCLTWLSMALLYTLASWRYRTPWLLAAAWLALDMGLLRGAAWLMPGGSATGASQILLATVAIQSILALWAHRSISAPLLGLPRIPVAPSYAAATIGGGIALGLTWGDRPGTLMVSLGLAIVAGTVAWFERREGGAWLAVSLVGLASLTLPATLGVTDVWSVAWAILGLLGVVITGWGLEWANGAHWRRASSLGALGISLLALLGVASVAPLSDDLPALTFALASTGLLLATLAVRLRAISYAYAAGAALVAAGMCQLADWGVRDPQGYVLPAGIYLLALADGLRRFQGRRKVSQVIEAGAAMLLLGATFGQALRGGGALYELLICGEALAVAAYGVLLRLRVPFVAGVGFFVAGVLWAAVDNVRISNQWVLFGTVGLLMIAAYVLLERHHERLLRAGRAWAAELRGWR